MKRSEATAPGMDMSIRKCTRREAAIRVDDDARARRAGGARNIADVRRVPGLGYRCRILRARQIGGYPER